MRILLIEDTRAGITTTTALLTRFGTVRAARTIEEARSVMASGWNPDAVVADLNLGDRRNWRETFAEVVEIAAGRPIAGHTAQVWDALLEEFSTLFSGAGAQLFSKRDDRPLLEWLQQMRRDESGALVQTMDRGSKQSHNDIRGEVVKFFEEMGAPHPGDEWLRDYIRCLVKWQSRGEKAWTTAWTTLVGLTVAGVFGWLVMAVMRWSGAGWQ